MIPPRAGSADNRDASDSETLRLEAEARARAEALVRDELRQRGAIEREVAALEATAGSARRLAAAVAGSRLVGLLAGYGAERPGEGSDSGRRAAGLRRARFRLIRRRRVLEGGRVELRRAAATLGGRSRRRRGAKRPPRTFAMALRRRSRPQREVSMLLAGPPIAVLRGSVRAARSSRRPTQLVLAPVRPGRPLGAAVAAAGKRTTGDVVAIATGASVRSPQRLDALADALLADPDLAAAAPLAIEFEWDSAAPRPVPRSPGSHRSAVALSGTFGAIRGALLRRHPPCADYRGPLWLTDLSIAASEEGKALVAIDDGLARLGPGEDDSFRPDLATLRRRWGPALRKRILADLLDGGGAWCPRAARILVDPECPPAVGDAVAALGLELASDPAGADVAIGSAGPAGALDFDWILQGERRAASVEALAGRLDREGPSALAAALADSARAAAFCLRIAGRDWDAAGYGGDAGLARSLARALGERGHQALLQVDADADLPAGECLDVLLVLRGRGAGEPSPGRLNLIWQISHPEETRAAELDRYDRVLVASRRHAEHLARSLRPAVEPLLQFTDPCVFRPAPGAAAEQDVAFVGNWRGEFRRIVWDAIQAGHPPALYGRGWDLLAPEHAVAEHVPHSELHRLYSSSRILLCDHWDDMRRHGFVSNRVFDALACETFVIADDNRALAETLPGVVATYSSPEDLSEKLERYLSRPEERQRLARSGRAIVLADHTVERRVEQLLAIAAAAARDCERPMTRHLRDRDREDRPGAPGGDGSAAAPPRREGDAGRR